MTDYAKEPQPDAAPTPPPTPRIALVDGATTTPLSAEALVVALFACVKDLDHGKVIALAVGMQAELDAGKTLALQASRVLRPTNGGGVVGL